MLNYSINEAGKILQKKGDWEADAQMFTDFVKAKPDSPTVVYALSQIGRAKAKLGKVDEAKQFLADTLKKYVDDPHRDSVEQILDQLASLCVRKKPPVADASASAHARGRRLADGPAPDPGAELDALLGASLIDQSPTAQARVSVREIRAGPGCAANPTRRQKNLLAIAAKFKPEVLPATILGLVGDALVAKGKLDEAAPFYQWLMDTYPKNDNVDFAYAGLGEIAFQKKQYDKALEYFKDGTDKIAANQKLKDGDRRPGPRRSSRWASTRRRRRFSSRRPPCANGAGRRRRSACIRSARSRASRGTGRRRTRIISGCTWRTSVSCRGWRRRIWAARIALKNSATRTRR